MRNRLVGPFVAGAIMIGGGLAACSSSSTGPSAGPDITGTWTLDTLTNAGVPVPIPPAQGTFTFTKDSVSIYLIVPVDTLGDLDTASGAGTYAITSKNLSVNTNNMLIGQATGTYRFANETAVPDTLKANFLANGFPVYVVVTRP
ncbi:MAG TPA: hypothetical protein VMG41_01190 [Gemmatimonadales bacterium]|nr:hypothetical protein [Gemmatimonadales bacterium]